MIEHAARRFVNHTVVITGAASGIGAATLRRFVAEGARVLAVDVNEPAGVTAEQAVEWIAADVADAGTWDHIAATTARHGGARVLVSNAASVDLAPAEDTSDESWNRQLDVSLSGAFRAARGLLPQLRRSNGNIVITSSVHAHFGLPGHPAYAAAKGGLCALARQLAAEYGPDIRVNTVVPGPIFTAMWDRVPQSDRDKSARQTTLGRLGDPDEVAACIAFLASDEASFVTGSEMVVDGGWSIRKDSA